MSDIQNLRIIELVHHYFPFNCSKEADSLNIELRPLQMEDLKTALTKLKRSQVHNSFSVD